MSVVISRVSKRALVVGVLALCAGVGAHALDAGETRASDGVTSPLSIRWLSPREGSTVHGDLSGSTCDATVDDINRIRKVTFSLDGSIFATDTAPPYTCNINTAGLPPGRHILKAEAYDSVGQDHSAYIYVSTRWTRRPLTTVTVQGDSLTVGSWWRIPAYLGPTYAFLSYSAHWGRPSGKGLVLLRRQRLGRVVMFALGTNDWWSTPRVYGQHLASVLQTIGPRRCLVLATIWRGGRPNRELNNVLYSVARRYGPAHVQLARWSEAVASGKVRLSPDGTHPDTQAGWNGRAAVLASAIRACGPTRQPTPRHGMPRGRVA